MFFNSFVKRLSHNINSEGLLLFVVRFFAQKTIGLFERTFSFHLIPAHFYSPILIVSKLSSNVYDKVFISLGLAIDFDHQLHLAKTSFQKYFDEFSTLIFTALFSLDVFFFYTFVRSKKLKKNVAIGAGDSSFIVLSAFKDNTDVCSQFTSIEPYPNPKLFRINDPCHSFNINKVQYVPLSFLRDSVFLFIDSCHVSKIGSDVNFEIHEIFPLLPVGALVHFHDITFPRNYWKDWISNGNQFWNESYLLHTFLLFNDLFNIKWVPQYIQTFHEEYLLEMFPFVSRNHRLTSFWIERTK